MKIVKRISLKSNTEEKDVEKRSVGRPKVFEEIKTYGFTFPPIYRKILELAAKDRGTSASALIREWIDENFKDQYLDEFSNVVVSSDENTESTSDRKKQNTEYREGLNRLKESPQHLQAYIEDRNKLLKKHNRKRLKEV